MSKKIDKVFYFDRPENVPQVVGCVVHPTEKSLYTLEANLPGWGGIYYGLCRDCINAARRDPNYETIIGDEILKRTKQLKEEMDNANSINRGKDDSGSSNSH